MFGWARPTDLQIKIRLDTRTNVSHGGWAVAVMCGGRGSGGCCIHNSICHMQLGNRHQLMPRFHVGMRVCG